MTVKISQKSGFTRQNFPKKNLGGLARMNFPKKMQGGFTLLETMIAITVLLIAVVGPISILGGSLRHIYFVRDQITAINLAQEGIEVVRQKRDTNFLDGAVAWDNGFAAGDCPGGGSNDCVIDTNPTPVIIKCTGACTQLVYKDPTDGFYHQYSAPPGIGIPATIFSRRVDTTKTNANEYKVTVVVTWSTGNTPGTVTVSESIFRWAKA